MELLLDTNALIYALYKPDELPLNIREMIEDEENDIYVSFTSLWEIAIKEKKKLKDFPFSYKTTWNLIMSKTDFKILSLHDSLLEEYGEIYDQKIHKDPFDILLLCLARHEEFTIITSDKKFEKYDNVDVITYC